MNFDSGVEIIFEYYETITITIVKITPTIAGARAYSFSFLSAICAAS